MDGFDGKIHWHRSMLERLYAGTVSWVPMLACEEEKNIIKSEED